MRDILGERSRGQPSSGKLSRAAPRPDASSRRVSRQQPRTKDAELAHATATHREPETDRVAAANVEPHDLRRHRRRKRCPGTTLRVPRGDVTSTATFSSLFDPRGSALRMKATPAGAVAIDPLPIRMRGARGIGAQRFRSHPSPYDLVNPGRRDLPPRPRKRTAASIPSRVPDQRVDAAVPAPGSDKRGTPQPLSEIATRRILHPTPGSALAAPPPMIWQWAPPNKSYCLSPNSRGRCNTGLLEGQRSGVGSSGERCVAVVAEARP